MDEDEIEKNKWTAELYYYIESHKDLESVCIIILKKEKGEEKTTFEWDHNCCEIWLNPHQYTAYHNKRNNFLRNIVKDLPWVTRISSEYSYGIQFRVIKKSV